MSGALAAILTVGPRAIITLTCGTFTGTDTWTGVDTSGNSGSTFGARSPTTYLDYGGNTRTIRDVDDQFGVAQLIFRLAGVSIPDTDTTFRAITVNGVRLVRSARTGYVPNAGGTDSAWTWAGTVGLPTSGTRFCVIE